MPKRIYIAGAISGLPEKEVIEKFNAAAKLLTDQGYEPFNPYAQIGCTPEFEGATWEQLMRTCIIVLMACDGVYLCHDWTISKGAIIEHDIARKVGIPIIYPMTPIKF